MEEIKKLLENWKKYKSSSIHRAFSKELEEAIERQEQLKCLMDNDKPNCDCELNHCQKKGG